MGTSLDTRPAKEQDASELHEFRVPHGKSKEYWYRDVLPPCIVAKADDTDRVSVSIVKKASGSDWSNVAIKRVAAVLTADPGRFAGLDAVTAATEMRRINEEGLKSASARGTGVHSRIEAMLAGLPVPADAAGMEYQATLDAFVAQYEPTSVLAEFVCFNRTLNGHGYAGTCDAIVDIKGKNYIVDWKSRGEDSRHSAYSQEGAQIGAYSMADYIVVDRERRAMPHLDGGLIVSLRPDGDFAIYPIELEAARQHFIDLHAWWVARQSERDAIGRMWPRPRRAKISPAEAAAPAPVEIAEEEIRPTSSATLAPDPVAAPDPALTLANSITEWGEPLRKMLAVVWPVDLPAPGKIRRGEATWDAGQLMRAQAAIDEIVGSWTEADRTAPTTPNSDRFTPAAVESIEGDRGTHGCDPVALDTLLLAIKAAPCRSIVNGWLTEAHAVARGWSPRSVPTIANYEITRAAFWLASIVGDAPEQADDETFLDLVRHILSTAMGTQVALMPANPIGVVLSHLTIAEAQAAAEAAQSLLEQRTLLTFSDQGAPVLVEAAAIRAA
jgi:hypothetical protein